EQATSFQVARCAAMRHHSEPSGSCGWSAMRFGRFTFGSIEIDGVRYAHDVVIDHGRVRKRKKKPSKRFRDLYGHTPLSAGEEIPWGCRRAVGGTAGQGCPR